MEVAGISLPLVFAAGFASFISPCVLPLMPGYLSTIGGASFDELCERRRGVTRLLTAAVGAGLLAVLGWALLSKSSGETLFAKIRADEKSNAPTFELPVSWVRVGSWPEGLRAAVHDGNPSLEELCG